MRIWSEDVKIGVVWCDVMWGGVVWGGKEANGSLSQVCTGLTRLCDVCVLFISVL